MKTKTNKITKINKAILNKKAYKEINELDTQEIRTAIAEFFNLLAEVFVSGYGVKFRYFGSFFLREQKPRRLYNVENKCYYDTGIVRVIRFTPSLKITKLIRGL